jgi:hypothetical protein
MPCEWSQSESPWQITTQPENLVAYNMVMENCFLYDGSNLRYLNVDKEFEGKHLIK